LHDGPGSFSGAGIAEADGLHGAKAQGVASATGQLFNGKAALEVVEFFPFLSLDRLGGKERVVEAVVFLFGEWAVDVVGGAFVVAGGKVDAVAVDGVGFNDGADGVVKSQVFASGQARDFSGERIGGER